MANKVTLSAQEREMARLMFPAEADPVVTYARAKLKLMNERRIAADTPPITQAHSAANDPEITVSQIGDRHLVLIEGTPVTDLATQLEADDVKSRLEACAMEPMTSGARLWWQNAEWVSFYDIGRDAMVVRCQQWPFTEPPKPFPDFVKTVHPSMPGEWLIYPGDCRYDIQDDQMWNLMTGWFTA